MNFKSNVEAFEAIHHALEFLNIKHEFTLTTHHKIELYFQPAPGTTASTFTLQLWAETEYDVASAEINTRAHMVQTSVVDPSQDD